jgi:hypothetical protein
MVESETSKGRPFAPGGIALLAILLTAVSAASAAPSNRGGGAEISFSSPPTPPPVPPTLSISLPEFPGSGTGDVLLQDRWSAAPAGCSWGPEWSTWALPSAGEAGGVFTLPDASSTEFVPASLTAMRSEVAVHSSVVLTCGDSNRTVEGVAFANVTTYPAPVLSDLSARPNDPAAPGRVVLDGFLAGGRPPYLLGVVWGDGTSTNRTLLAPGEFQVPHVFFSGDFQPRVGVYDADRIDVRAELPDPIEVGNGTRLSVDSTEPLAEVGVPVEFRGSAEDPGVHDGAAIACGAVPVVHPGLTVTNVTCVPAASGTLPVTFKLGVSAPSARDQVTFDQPVAPPVTVVVRPVDDALDSGTATFLRLTIAGGVPPFRASWSVRNAPLGARSNLSSDGSLLVPWTPSFTGEARLNATVSDALGVSAQSLVMKVTVAPAPHLALVAYGSASRASTTVQVDATLVGGSPPIVWSLVTASTPPTEALPLGESNSGSFNWSATYSSEGLATFDLEVEDAAFTLETNSTSAELPVGPNVQVSGTPSALPGSAVLNLTLTTEGGQLPFDIWVNSSDGPLWNGTEASPGPYEESLSLGATGTVAVSVTLLDARGGSAEANLTVTLPPALPPAPPTPPPGSASPGTPPPISGSGPDLAPWAAGAALAAVAIGLVLARGRRAARTAEEPAPDPEAILERLLSPADGADRLTIELMAEEEGVPLETVRRTLDRLIRDGRVRSETDPDGGEVLAWAAA